MLAVADAIIAAGWVKPRPCDHDWSKVRGTYGENPWRECNLCGYQQDL